jgi:membrane glycosyltransferase
MVLSQSSFAVALPAPAASIFKIPESTRVTMLAASTARHRQQTAQMARATGTLTEPVSARTSKLHRHAPTANAPHTRTEATPIRRQTTDAAHAIPGAPKHAVQGKKNARSVRVAGLKKR